MKSKKDNAPAEYYGVVSDCKKGIHRLVTKHPECDYEEIKLLGKGEKADVYLTNCNNKEYAMKVTTSYQPASFKDEVFNQIAVGSELSPQVYDAFTCNDKKGYIVMDKLNGTITEYIRKATNDPIKRKELVNYYREIAKKKFKMAADKGVIHSDTHVDNMMIKEDELGNPELYFIDWGIANKRYMSEEELDKKMIDLDQTFDLLLREINLSTTKTPAAPKKVQKTRQVYTERKEEESPSKKLKMPGFQSDSKINPIDYSSFEEVKDNSTPIKPFSSLQFDDDELSPSPKKKMLSFDDDEPSTPPLRKKMLSFDDDEDDFPRFKRLTYGEESLDDYPNMSSSPF